jgi:8-oxo-dGTP pyrophosphatase MutT (NUDIX family)
LLDARAWPTRIRRRAIRRKPRKRKARPVLRVQYAALPYRFTPTAALEILLVTTRRSRRWIIPKGWPIKGLKPPKSAAREAFEEAGVRGKVGMKSVGVFNYDKLLAENGIPVNCEVRVFPLLVKRQSEVWPEFDQRLVQWGRAEQGGRSDQGARAQEARRGVRKAGCRGGEQNGSLKSLMTPLSPIRRRRCLRRSGSA